MVCYVFLSKIKCFVEKIAAIFNTQVREQELNLEPRRRDAIRKTPLTEQINAVFAYVISLILNTNPQKKKNWTMFFQSNCSSHAKIRTNLSKIKKRPKIRHRSVMFSALQKNKTQKKKNGGLGFEPPTLSRPIL